MSHGTAELWAAYSPTCLNDRLLFVEPWMIAGGPTCSRQTLSKYGEADVQRAFPNDAGRRVGHICWTLSRHQYPLPPSLLFVSTVPSICEWTVHRYDATASAKDWVYVKATPFSSSL